MKGRARGSLEMKKVASVILLLLGFIITYTAYSINTSGNFGNISLIMPLVIIAICSIIISVILNKKMKDRFKYFLYSFLLSYFICFCLMAIKSFIIDDFVLVFFSPIIFMFLLPMISMCVFSVYLFKGGGTVGMSRNK
jgi:hypothetical protein